MKEQENIIQCDKCQREFPYNFIKIKESSVKINGNILKLDYFTCPFCNTVYKVLLVEETKYRKLLEDFMSVQKRISQNRGKGDLVLMQRLADMAEKKQGRIKAYVDSISKKYPGTFELVVENNQQYIKYLP